MKQYRFQTTANNRLSVMPAVTGLRPVVDSLVVFAPKEPPASVLFEAGSDDLSYSFQASGLLTLTGGAVMAGNNGKDLGITTSAPCTGWVVGYYD